MSIDHNVLELLKTFRPFSEDAGVSSQILDSFTKKDWETVHWALKPWIALRPGVGGKLYGFEAVRLPHTAHITILAPNGTVYPTAFVWSCSF